MHAKTFPIAAIAAIACLIPLGAATAKSPGQRICFNDVCHRVHTINETVDAIGRVDRVIASYYDAPEHDSFNPRLETSSGEMLDPDAPNNAASPIWPDGTILLVRAERTGLTAIVRINNAGPYSGRRLIDVSRGLAERLGLVEHGIGIVETVVLSAPTEEDASFRRDRVYPVVAGPIGAFANIEDALGRINDATTATAPASRADGERQVASGKPQPKPVPAAAPIKRATAEQPTADRPADKPAQVVRRQPVERVASQDDWTRDFLSGKHHQFGG